MNPAERTARILQAISHRPHTLDDLREMADTSPAQLRRDLEAIEISHELCRVGKPVWVMTARVYETLSTAAIIFLEMEGKAKPTNLTCLFNILRLFVEST